MGRPICPLQILNQCRQCAGILQCEGENMKKELTVTDSIKAYSLVMLEKYKKAMPIIRVDTKFKEEYFMQYGTHLSS